MDGNLANCTTVYFFKKYVRVKPFFNRKLIFPVTYRGGFTSLYFQCSNESNFVYRPSFCQLLSYQLALNSFTSL